MAASKWRQYHTFNFEALKGSHDLSSNDIKIILLASSSNAATLTHDKLADLDNQLATANGYTQNDYSLTNVTLTNNDDGTVDLDSDDAQWTASGGSLTARFAVLYNEDATDDLLIAYCLLDDAPADITATDTNAFNVAMSTDGIVRLTGATA